MKGVFLFFLMTSFFLLSAQTKGLVVNSDNTPIHQANIYLLDQNLLLFSDKEGVFFIEDEIPNYSYIHFYKHGYASKIIRYENDIPLQVNLEKLHIDLDEIGVAESFNVLGNSKLTNIEKKSLSFLESNSMLESVAQLNGVDMISSGLGIQKVVVRGLSGMRVVTYLNGMQINNQQWANDHGIGFTDLGLKEVELIKGASALKYGSEAIGGVLYFKDNPFISSKKIKGYVASKFNNSSYLSSNQFGIKWGSNNFYFTLYGQHSISSDYRLPNDWYLFNSRFKQNAVKFSASYRYKNWQNIFRYHLHNEVPGIPGHIHGNPNDVALIELTSSDLDLATDFTTSRPSQNVNNKLFIYETSYMKDNLKFSLYAGHFINNLQEWEKWTRPAFDIDLSNTQIAPNIRYNISNLTLNFGSQITMLNNKNKIDDRLVPDASSINIGPYVIIDFEKDNYGFNTGLRYDYKNLIVNDKSDQFNIDYDKVFSNSSFSAGLYYKIFDHVLRGTYSGAYRAPYFSELFSDGVHHGTNRYEIGDENLNMEHANQLELKYQWANDHFGLIVNPFVQHISDFISINPVDTSISGYKVYNYIQYDQVEIKGVEMNFHYHPHQLHNLHLEQSYSFLQTKNQDDKYGLALVPANSIKTKIIFDFDNYAKLSRYKLDYFSFYHVYKFEQDSYAEYEELTPSYNVLNFQLGLKFSKEFNCTVSINNLLNEEYTPHISRVRGVAGGVPNPGRFFSVNVKYEF
tara:strand:- start:866 stop:3088 length:2223 start_codon:yes stop_codon:yes gene_type:complete